MTTFIMINVSVKEWVWYLIETRYENAFTFTQMFYCCFDEMWNVKLNRTYNII